MKSHTTMYVNPVQRQSVQGRDKQMYTLTLSNGDVVSTVPMKKTKSFGVGSEFTFLIDFAKNKLDTGLDEMILNPFKDMTVDSLKSVYSLSSYWEDSRLESIVNSDNIKKQTYFEILADVKEGYYTSEVKATIFNSRDLKKAEEPSFLQKFKIVLYDRPNKFTTETPRGRMAIQLISRLNTIAKSKQLVNSAFHNYYVSEENEAEKEKLKKQDYINDAIYHLYGMKKENTDYQNYMVAILMKHSDDKVLLKGKVNSDTVRRKLNTFVTGDSPQQLQNIKRFMDAAKLLKTSEGMETLHIKYLIQQAINSNVMSVRDGYYVWHSRQGEENVYKFTNYKALYSLIKKEFEVYNENEKEITNWYGELVKEVKGKGITIEV